MQLLGGPLPPLAVRALGAAVVGRQLVGGDAVEPGLEAALAPAEPRQGPQRPLERRGRDLVRQLRRARPAVHEGVDAVDVAAVQLGEGVGIGAGPLDEVLVGQRRWRSGRPARWTCGVRTARESDPALLARTTMQGPLRRCREPRTGSASGTEGGEGATEVGDDGAAGRMRRRRRDWWPGRSATVAAPPRASVPRPCALRTGVRPVSASQRPGAPGDYTAPSPRAPRSASVAVGRQVGDRPQQPPGLQSRAREADRGWASSQSSAGMRSMLGRDGVAGTGQIVAGAGRRRGSQLVRPPRRRRRGAGRPGAAAASVSPSVQRLPEPAVERAERDGQVGRGGAGHRCLLAHECVAASVALARSTRWEGSTS